MTPEEAEAVLKIMDLELIRDVYWYVRPINQAGGWTSITSLHIPREEALLLAVNKLTGK